MGLGQPLRFSRDEDISWSPQIATGRPAARFTELSAALALHSRPDPRLLNVWADLREFSARVNDTVARGAKVPMDIASRLATSVPHRLLRLRVDEGLVGEGAACGGLLHELLRLCMLAYAKTLLIKLPGIGRKMVVLVEGLRGSLTAWHCDLRLRAVGGGVSGEDVLEGARRLLLCAVFVASVAIFEESDEDWLHDILVQTVMELGLRAWGEARAVLKEFLWIDIVFDRPGERLFRQFSLEGREGGIDLSAMSS